MLYGVLYVNFASDSMALVEGAAREITVSGLSRSKLWMQAIYIYIYIYTRTAVTAGNDR